MKRSFYWSRLFAGKRRAHNAKLQQRHGSSSGTVAKLFDCVQLEASGAARDEAGETKIAADRTKVPGELLTHADINWWDIERNLFPG